MSDSEDVGSGRTLADWGLAERVGRRVAGLTPVAATAADVARLRAQVSQAVAVADQASRTVTTLGADLGPATARVIGRGEWIRANLASMRHLTDPFAADLLARSAVPATVSATVVGAQVGAIFGFLSTRVLGQYEVFLPEEEGTGRLTLVGPNLLQAERELAGEGDIDGGDLVLGVVLHELGHRLQFEAVPWLRAHLLGIITTYLGETQIDPDRVRSGLRQLLERVREGGLELRDVLEAFLTPAQASEMARAQALMSLLEGHGNIVMDWGVEELVEDGVDPSRVRQALNARRNSHRGPGKFVGRALGLGMKAKQYAVGEAFIAEVARVHGRQAFHRVWEDPANVPTPEELEDPEAWVHRVRGSTA